MSIYQNLPMLEQTLASVFLTYQANLTAPLYVGCSGGADSLSLAFACVRLYQQGILPTLPTLIHINHQLQAMSEDWAMGVQDFANQYQLPCHIIKLNLIKSDEKTAREGRYQAFFETMADGGVLFLAHHANDQAETLLMRLMDGAGLDGLSAMKEWQVRHHQTANGTKTIALFRPMLALSREAIESYANTNHLPYVNDPTNVGEYNVRSVMRGQLLPVLKQINPKAVENMARSAKLLGLARDRINQRIDEVYQLCLDVGQTQLPFVAVLNLKYLEKLNSYDRQMVVRRFVQANAKYPPSLAMSERVLSLIERVDNDHRAELFWQDGQGGVVLVRYRACLYRYRFDVWAFLRGDNDNFTLKINGLNDILGFDKVQLPKKHRQRLAIPAWLANHLWQGQVEGQTVIITLGRCVALGGQGVMMDKNAPTLAICENLR